MWYAKKAGGLRFLARPLLLIRQRLRYKTEASSTRVGLKAPLSFLKEGGGCVRLQAARMSNDRMRRHGNEIYGGIS